MLGSMIASYVFAVQSRLDTARDFSNSLIQQIPPSMVAKKSAKKVIQNTLLKQYREKNR